jgi:hypothetical protein
MNFKFKERVEQNTKFSNKGITLIALVITIIVLLILAGVTIITLTGDNGILTQAKSAKTQNEKSSIKEQIELAVQTSRINDNNNASIDTTILEQELNANGITDITKEGENDGLPWTVTVNGYIFQIKEDGTVESVNGISLSQTTLKMVQGQEELITATVTEGITGTVTWLSSNTSVVTVNNGTIKAVGTSGTADITASVSGTDYSAKCTVTIVSKVTAISVSDLTVEEGSSKQLTVTTTPSSDTEELTYESDNKDIATVDSTGKVTGVAEGTATITVAGKISTTVTKTCTVTVKAKEFIGEAINTDKYGWKVKNYTVQTSEMSTNVWRLFYQDSDNTYIITDECIGSYKPSDYYSKYTSGADVSTEGKNLNSKISSLLVETNTNKNIRATAWLTDTTQWAQYKSNDAEYAIGSPTAELFAASYNNRSNKSKTISLGVGSYGYTNNTERGWLNASDNHGIYNKSTSSFWWLASPIDGTTLDEMYVFGSKGYLSNDYVSNSSRAVRPIVCIQTSVFNEKYTLLDE